jgi:hexosaminidase
MICWNLKYSKAYYDIQASIWPSSDGNGVLWKLETKDKDAKISVTAGGSSDPRQSLADEYTVPLLINHSTSVIATMYENKNLTGRLMQKFSFNEATGRKITLTTIPDTKYPGNGGAFGLVNGAVSSRGINSDEWLGWNGNDMEAVIDLGKDEQVSNVSMHVLDQKRSQVYPPAYMEVYSSVDGTKYTLQGKTDQTMPEDQNMSLLGLQFAPLTTRYIKIYAKNFGTIPAGQPGAGKAAWLFCDELSVN